MAENWSRSDWFSIMALAISIGAFLNSGYQTLIARRKAKADAEATKPIVDDIKFEPVNHWKDNWTPGWFILSLRIRNRSDYTLNTDRLKIKSPRNVRISSSRLTSGRESALPNKPPIDQLGATAEGNSLILRPKGSVWSEFEKSSDVCCEEFFLFISSSRSFIKSKKLVMSLSLVCTNRSVSNSEINIVTSMPDISALAEYEEEWSRREAASRAFKASRKIDRNI